MFIDKSTQPVQPSASLGLNGLNEIVTDGTQENQIRYITRYSETVAK